MRGGKDEVLFEFHQSGNVVKVSALHVSSNTEVAIVGPQHASEYALKAAALRKLKFIMEKKSGKCS